MPTFKLTSESGKGKSAHHHVLFVDENTGEALISVGSGSTRQAKLPHLVRYVPPVAEQRDPNGNLLVAAQVGGFYIEPADDGHSHDITDFELPDFSSFKENEGEETVLNDMMIQFKACIAREDDSLNKARESYDFVYGNQWNSSQKNKLGQRNRAALTVNEIAQNVEELSGYQREQRTDIHFSPVEDGDSSVASILNTVVKVILEACFFAREESKAFEDTIIGGRGNLNLYIDQLKDIRGVPIVERFPYDQVTYGEHEKEDLSDCEILFKHKMYSLKKLQQLYPDKKDQLTLALNSYKDLVSITSDDSSKDAYDPSNATTVSGYKLVDIVSKEFRLIERWLRVYVSSYVITAPTIGFYFNAFGWTSEDIKLVKSIEGGKFTVIDRQECRMRITKACGNVILYDEITDLDDFYILPIYGKKHGDLFVGKVEGVKDAQRIVNFHYSQMIDIINKMIAHVWFYDSNTFSKPSEKKKFLQNSSTPGSAFELLNSDRPPRKEEGTSFPNGLAEVVMGASNKIKELFNIAVAPGGANESGQALLQKQKLRLTGNQFLFDNLSFTKQLLGRKLIKIIQKYYTPDRIYRILKSQNLKEPVNVGGKPLDEYSEESIITLLQTADLDMYDVAITESGNSPTSRMSTYLMMKEMAQAGQQIPPEIMIEFADIPKSVKDQILARIQQANDQASQVAQTNKESEENKTLIAAGIIPPKIQQKLDMQAQEVAGSESSQNGVPNFGNDIVNNAQIT